MKRFLRSKLVLSLAAFLMIAAAIAIPLSGSLIHTHAASPTTPPVSISSINGTFYPNPNNSGSFDPSVLSSPVFSQQFPVLSFDPPTAAQVSCSNATGVDENTRPFTDVLPQSNGTCSTVVAQDPKNPSTQAGLGNLFMFQATFTANLTLANAGDVTFNFFSDDGWILASGPEASHPSGQPSYVSGSLVNAPANGYITKFPVVGSFNQPSSPAQNTVTVHFPISGTFPIEVDYTECCGGPETLVLGTSFGNPIPPPPPTSTRTLFVLIGGLSSELKLSDLSKPVGFEALEGFLKTKGGFGNADFMAYSYPIDKKGQNQGLPHDYGCVDTFDHTLNQDVRTLHLQILNYLNQHPNQSTNIYLIGDSLGGVIGFGYLALLKSMGWPSLPNGQLKGVITLAAPLGGIPSGDKIITGLVFKAKCLFKASPLITIKPLDELVSVFNTTNSSTPLGGMAKLAQVVFPKISLLKGVTNQMLANEAAKLTAPIHVLTIGNTRDFGFVPAMCQALQDRFPVLFLLLTNFESSQFVKNQKPPAGVYGREITAGNQFCSISIFFNQVNHGETLKNSDVENGIVDFINHNNPKPLMAP